jgi:putative membrane protein
MFALALLHPIANLSWWRWSIHPSTVIGIAALGALYIWASRKLRQSPTDTQKIFFVSGLLLMFATLNGPIHDLSDDYLFSAHMVQHLVLTLAVPPLLLVSAPAWMVDALLRPRPLASATRLLTRPVPALALYTAALVGWHLPAPYNLALVVHGWHIVEHLTLMAAATIAWWPVLG